MVIDISGHPAQGCYSVLNDEQEFLSIRHRCRQSQPSFRHQRSKHCQCNYPVLNNDHLDPF